MDDDWATAQDSLHFWGMFHEGFTIQRFWIGVSHIPMTMAGNPNRKLDESLRIPGHMKPL